MILLKRLRKRLRRFGRATAVHLGHTLWQRRPNEDLFDAAWYLAQNPDVAAAGVDPLKHYIEHGRTEGREAPPGFSEASPERRWGSIGWIGGWRASQSPPAGPSGTHVGSDSLVVHGREAVSGRKWVIVVSHQASRTGASILAINIIKILILKYNVVCLLLRDGELTSSFATETNLLVGPIRPNDRNTDRLLQLMQGGLGNILVEYGISKYHRIKRRASSNATPSDTDGCSYS